MKKTYFLATLLCAYFVRAQQTNSHCENLYSNVTYAMTHTKKALDVTGFDHQVYYAERALKMFEKSKEYILSCTCNAVEEKSFQAVQNLKKAVDPIDWYAGRFYSKKALGEIDAMITALDNCSSENYVEPDVLVSNNTKNLEEAGKDFEMAHLQYNSYLEELNTSIEKLLSQLEKDFKNGEEGDQIQKKYYTDQTRKLLRSAILQIEDANE